MRSQSSQQELNGDSPASPWPHRWAWLLAVGVFPLIWIGGLVTTYEAGMSVPDWPTTYDSWFYPLQKWLWTFNDLFLEHSHRTIAQIDGFIAVALFVSLLISVLKRRYRIGVLILSGVIIIGLISQGVLGGLRVVFDDRVLARIHGCAAPLVFALCTAMTSITSTAWRSGAMFAKRAERDGKHESSQHMPSTSVGMAPAPAPELTQTMGMAPILSAAICGGLYIEIVLGAQFRHPLPDVAPVLSPILVWSKVIIAALLLVGMIYLLFKCPHPASPGGRADNILFRRIKLLVVLYILQLILAGATWVSNFGWPKWFTDNVAAINYTVVQNGRMQIWATTGHAAVGSLCFVTAICVTMWSYRLLRPGEDT